MHPDVLMQVVMDAPLLLTMQSWSMLETLIKVMFLLQWFTTICESEESGELK
jgi:hypothetical protein